MKKAVARCKIMNVRDALHSYLNLAEATKIRLHAEIETPPFGGVFSYYKKENAYDLENSTCKGQRANATEIG